MILVNLNILTYNWIFKAKLSHYISEYPLCALITKTIYRKLWSSGRVLGSRLEGRGIDPHPMLDGSGVKTMPGSIPAPNPGSFNIIK
jgi:hypothetical protein